MAGQSVFKGALGWDDWIWWSGIGGLGLLLLMLILCCVVCMQRAKRKGREEALATVQARERERQQQEQAQLRYAQAQQARYPAREASYKFSKPEPPQATLNPYGHEDHAMHRNSYLQNAPQPRPKNRRDAQQHQQLHMQQPPPPLPQEQYTPHGQAYYAMPAREEPPPPQQQQYSFSKPMQEERPPPRLEPEELPQVAAYYGRKTHPQADAAPAPRPSGPVFSQQYQRQQQVNPNQPPLMQYRKQSARSDTINGGSFVQDEPAHTEVPFVQVTTPRGSSTSTASTTFSTSAAAPANAQPSAPSPIDRGSSVLNSSMLRAGGTLRDRIDALRDGTAPGPAGPDNYTRVSVGSAASSGHSLPSQHQHQPSPPTNTNTPIYTGAPAPRRMDAVSNTVLSDSSSMDNEFAAASYENAFDEEAYNTARSRQGLQREDSDRSVGVDDAPLAPRDKQRRDGRSRADTGDSTGSIEF